MVPKQGTPAPPKERQAQAPRERQTHADEYHAGKIQVLKGLEAVRRRPGMYIGSTGARGLHHLVYEVVDNSIDEAMAGYCDRVEVTIHPDNSVTVRDNGRGIPIDVHPTEKIPGVEVAMTMLHAGGKFDHASYKVSGGLHGVGVSVVNALSESLEVVVEREGKVYRQRYERGIKATELEAIGKTRSTGTTVTFKPDTKVFTELEFIYDTLSTRMRELAFLNKGVTIVFRDEREDGREETYLYKGGIVEFVKWLNASKKPLHKDVLAVEQTREDVVVELALQYNDSYSETVFTFVNNINTHEGGTHLTGFKSALTRTLNAHADRNNLLKKGDSPFTGDDVREGLTAVLSVKVMEPQFEGQTKTKLGNSEVQGIVASVVNEQLGSWLEENPGAARAIIEKALSAARAREAARKARELVRKKSALEGGILPGKLADCAIDNPELAEIFLVEGESAGGCLAGDTLVPLASGIKKTMLQLAEDWKRGVQHYGFASSDAGDIRIVPLYEPRLTKRRARLVEVELSNGERLRCTPDHPFRLRDGSYRPAIELGPGDSLMPFKTRLTTEKELPRPGYEMVWMNGERRGRRSQIEVPGGYDAVGLGTAPTALRCDTLAEEDFNDSETPWDVSANVNCKVVRVRQLSERADVYDLTVDVYQNFALGVGVFVHNSAKQGRDRNFQAILPLRGKILNTEKARIDKILSNEEIRAIAVAIGTGLSGEEFDLSAARYRKIIAMSVHSDDDILVRNEKGVRLTKIGSFIDGALEGSGGTDVSRDKRVSTDLGDILCFGIRDHSVRFRPIKGVIRHRSDEPLIEIRTAYGRSLRITAGHSVYVYENGKLGTKPGNELRVGDRVVAPRLLRLPAEAPPRIDVLRLLRAVPGAAKQVWLRGPAVEEWFRAGIPAQYAEDGEYVAPLRGEFSQKVGKRAARHGGPRGKSGDVTAVAGATFTAEPSNWNKGMTQATIARPNAHLGVFETLRRDVHVRPIGLERSQATPNRGLNRARGCNRVCLAHLSPADVDWFEDREDLELTPRNYPTRGVSRYIKVTPDLMTILGFYLAEGSCCEMAGIRFTIGRRNTPLLHELSQAIERSFGQHPQFVKFRDYSGELRLVNRVLSLVWKYIFGFNNTTSINKSIPDIVFNVSEELRIAFLRGYLLGDGTVARGQVAFDSSSRNIVSGVMYLLSSLGIISSVSKYEPDGVVRKIRGLPCQTKEPHWKITIVARQDLARMRVVWQDHPGAHSVETRLASAWPSINRRFTEIDGDLIALPIKSISQVEPTNGYVYDFSVEGDENFIAGTGGIAAHNTDADVDGSHIRTLLLTFLYRYMKELIEAGYIYIAQPPLYRVAKGKQEVYVHTEEERDAAVKAYGDGNITIQRYKGLGEMNPDELWKTTMDPETRTLLKVTMEDAVEADRLFSVLMGDEVEPRRQFIEANAKYVRNLDV